MGYQYLIYRKEDRIARVTLNRPKASNALSPGLIEELEDVIKKVTEDTEVKALVINAEGAAFCAGADLKFILNAFEDWKLYVPFLVKFNEVMLALKELPVPTIAVAQGHTLAGGLELLLSCDLAIAAEDAAIGDQHTTFGLMGVPINTLLPRRIGEQRAMELLFTGGRISGKEAERIGLVLKAVPKEKLEEEVERIVSQLRDKSRDAFGPIKRSVAQGMVLGLKESYDYTSLLAMRYFSTSDKPKQGVRSFIEKKGPPKF